MDSVYFSVLVQTMLLCNKIFVYQVPTMQVHSVREFFLNSVKAYTAPHQKNYVEVSWILLPKKCQFTGFARQEGEQRMTAFNMREELEEGHFDRDGHFIWSNEKEVSLRLVLIWNWWNVYPFIIIITLIVS